MAERSDCESTARRGARRLSARARFAAYALAALAALALAGCVIGPKPDEPGASLNLGDDSGAADTEINAGDDTGVVASPSDAAADTNGQKNDAGGTVPTGDGCGDAADAETGDAPTGCGDASDASDASDARDDDEGD